MHEATFRLARRLETARARAMNAADTVALRAMLADDLVYVHSNGQSEPRDRYLASLASGSVAYRGLSLPVDRVVHASPTVLVLHGRLEGEVLRAPQVIPMRSLCTVVWARAHARARWRLLHFQATRAA